MTIPKDFICHQGPIPDREFVLFKEPGGPEAIWKRPPADDRPVVTIIIPTADADRNGLFLKLVDQLADPGLSNIEIIVLVGDRRQGRAINIGAAMSRAEFILTMDDDTRLYGIEWLERLLAAMESDPSIGMAGGINRIPGDAGAFVRNAMEQLPRRASPPVTAVTDSDLAEHPLLLMRRADFIAVGGEHERLPRGLDPYLRECFRKHCRRVVVVPDVYYSHLPPETPLKLVRQFFRNGWYSAFCQKNFPRWVFDTPADHVAKLPEKNSLGFRVFRHILALMGHVLKRHFIYIIANIAYAMGFIGYHLSMTIEAEK